MAYLCVHYTSMHAAPRGAILQMTGRCRRRMELQMQKTITWTKLGFSLATLCHVAPPAQLAVMLPDPARAAVINMKQLPCASSLMLSCRVVMYYVNRRAICFQDLFICSTYFFSDFQITPPFFAAILSTDKWWFYTSWSCLSTLSYLLISRNFCKNGRKLRS